MKVMWKAITDYDVEQLVKEYGLTETELQILNLRRKGVAPEAIPFRINYQRSRTYEITANLTVKIVQMLYKKP